MHGVCTCCARVCATLQVGLQLVTLCLSMNELPFIRYDNRSQRCRNLARMVEGQINRLAADLEEWKVGLTLWYTLGAWVASTYVVGS